MTGWETLGGVSQRRLAAARLQMHHAAQPAAAVGKLLLPHQADFGEQSFGWSQAAGALVQGLVSAPTPFRAALRPGPPALLLLLGADDQVVRQLPLHGRTLDETYAWLGDELPRLLGRPLPGGLERPEGLPAHPLLVGGRFDDADGEAFAELGRLYANAERALAAWAAATPGTSPVRCWPHHFDIAVLAPAAPEQGPYAAPPAELAEMMPEVPEAAGAAAQCTLGVGLVPGDDALPEPYFYVTPWPYPEAPELPPLAAGGSWHTAGWLGAVLPAARFMDARPAAAQAATVEEFIGSAAAACRRLLARRGEARG